ncbi:3-hydroxyisobutyryl-CoA hydrolase 1-like isoform X10 [Primulina eburnea]|uniref:3-hydroxyisobutyryl-CoA hydrolase 1-like isoform X10 n=1 Tax=Primulina eburnea TaxID=1245227 RepID=UPI003C6C50AA
MLVPEARGTSLGFLLVCWQMLAFIFFYGTRESICAGVDVAVVVRDITLGNWRSGASYFRKEFTLNYVMATYYSKPQVSILNGIVMGGGGACFCTCFLLCLKQHWDSSLT